MGTKVQPNTWSKENLENIQEVNSLKGLKRNVTYQTKNYSLFSHLKGNRGAKNGVENSRVLNFVELITLTNYYPVMGIIYVNSSGTILEGHSKYNALMLTNKPIIFKIVTNMTVGQVAQFNTNKSSNWSPNTNFKSALQNGSKLANALLKVQAIVSNQSGLKSKITTGEMFAVLKQEVRYLVGGAKNTVMYDEYFDYSLLDKAESAEFCADMVTYGTIKSIIEKETSRILNVMKVVFQSSLENNFMCNFKLVDFKNALLRMEQKNEKFVDYRDSMRNRQQIMDIHNKKIAPSRRAVKVTNW